MRKTLSKDVRMLIFNKYNGRCAYCGEVINIEDMQVDHMRPLNAWSECDCGSNEISNLMPSCRACNNYKSRYTLEEFRHNIATIRKKLARDSSIYRIGVKYGMFNTEEENITFYFEKETQ